MLKLPAVCVCCLLFFASVAQSAALQLSDTASIFGKGIISTGDFESNVSFTPDGNTAFFCIATINFGYIAIFKTERKNGQWSKPAPVNFTGVYRDTDPFVSADGKRLYFSSDRPINGRPFKDYDYHLFYVTLSGNKITSTPTQFTAINEASIKLFRPSFAANGNIYFFNRDSSGDADIYMSEFKDGSYQSPVKLGFNDKKFYDFDPVIAKDESFIIFASNNRKGEGSGDLFVSFNKSGVWTEPVNMGTKINTKGNDGAPCLSQDDKTLYFTSYRQDSPRPVYKNGGVTIDALMKVLHSTDNGVRHIYAINIASLQQKQ